jgi:transposase
MDIMYYIMYYIGLDVHKKTISYCVKDASGQVTRK